MRTSEAVVDSAQASNSPHKPLVVFMIPVSQNPIVDVALSALVLTQSAGQATPRSLRNTGVEEKLHTHRHTRGD